MTQDQTPVRWRKSSRSNAENNCVEVAPFVGCVAIRDSKDASAPPVALTPGGFAALVANVRAGRHDLA
ncbi:DUF397 domain-containing protein [Actinomadura macra]|uniref:DUF397 domain-containing protein n=1 Tax=Actinomadura macra TaxID=46164 RepID=UPI000A008510